MKRIKCSLLPYLINTSSFNILPNSECYQIHACLQELRIYAKTICYSKPWMWIHTDTHFLKCVCKQLSLCIPRYMGGQAHSTTHTCLYTRRGWVVSFRTPTALPPEKSPPPQYWLNRWLGGPQSRYGHFEAETNPLPLPGIKPQFLRRPTHHLATIWAVLKVRNLENMEQSLTISRHPLKPTENVCTHSSSSLLYCFHKEIINWMKCATSVWQNMYSDTHSIKIWFLLKDVYVLEKYMALQKCFTDYCSAKKIIRNK